MQNTVQIRYEEENNYRIEMARKRAIQKRKAKKQAFLVQRIAGLACVMTGIISLLIPARECAPFFFFLLLGIGLLFTKKLVFGAY